MVKGFGRVFHDEKGSVSARGYACIPKECGSFTAKQGGTAEHDFDPSLAK